jgi:hypothetical protein
MKSPYRMGDEHVIEMANCSIFRRGGGSYIGVCRQRVGDPA